MQPTVILVYVTVGSYVLLDVILGLVKLGPLFLIGTIIHASYSVGYKQTIFFLIGTPFVEWIVDVTWLTFADEFKKLGYHSYKYNDSAGILLGKVPLIALLGFGSMIYHAFYVSALIIYEPLQNTKRSIFSLYSIIVAIHKALVSSFVVTCWALGSERYMLDDGFYSVTNPNVSMFNGVPIGHFVAWAVVTFSFFFPYNLFANTSNKFISSASNWMRIIPIISYAGWAIFYVKYYLFVQKDYELVLVLVFTMGFCVLLSITRLVLLGFESETINSDKKKNKLDNFYF